MPQHNGIPKRAPATEILAAFYNVTLLQHGLETLRNITWTIRAGEQWAVLGFNGAGKSALLAALNGQAIIHRGEVSFGRGLMPPGEPGGIASISFRLHRLFVEQEDAAFHSRWYADFDSPTPTAREILSRAHAATPAAIARVARKLGVARLLDRHALHLSTGEMRRILVARALLSQPRLLLLDEPFIGLDSAMREEFRATLEALGRSSMSLVVFSARPDDLPRGSTQRLWLKNCRVAGTTRTGARQAAALRQHIFPARIPRKIPAPIQTPTRPARHASAPAVELHSVAIDAPGQHILRNIDWTIRRGECWALAGPNGSGKTTLLSVIIGDHPQAFAQDVRLFGRPRGEWPLAQLKARIGWAAPDLLLHYSGDTTVLELACTGYANSMALYQRCSRRQTEHAQRWLAYFGLSRALHRPFRFLSEGQQRLALLARALVKQPRLLALDEPCQGLDEGNRARVLFALDEMCKKYGTTLIYVTHYTAELPRCIDHVLTLKGGRVDCASQRNLGR